MLYQHRIEKSLPRLLNLGCLDLRGKSYGSFDRNFWHLRQRDFSTSTAQMAALPLMRSSYYQNDGLRDFLHHSLLFLEKIQHRNGSFDEWYPNEKGWGGPTSYLLDFIARTYIEFHQELPLDVCESLLRVIRKASSFTIKGWERDVLFNHVALSTLALEGVHKIDSSIVKSQDLLIAKNWLERHFCQDEGWGSEYGQADPGYQSATVSFLAKAHQLRADDFYRDLCLGSLDFMQYFHFPDGSYAHGIGARETSCLFDFGVQYWSAESKVAAALAQSAQEMKCGLDETALDDHYFVYRMLEISDSAQLPFIHRDTSISSQSYMGRKYIEQANILVLGSEEKYSVCNLSKGLALIEFDKKRTKFSRFDYGVMVEESGRLYSSFVSESPAKIELTEDKIIGLIPLYEVKANNFRPATNLIFRLLMMTLGLSSKASYLLKTLIRSMMTTRNRRSGATLLRRVTLQNNCIVSVDDDLSEFKSGARIYQHGILENRYVPQSKYQSHTKLSYLPSIKVEKS